MASPLKRLFALGLFFCLPLWLFVRLASAEDAQIVAEIDGEKITLRELDQEILLQSGFRQPVLDEKQLHEFRRLALDRFIERRLLLNAAKKSKIEISAETLEAKLNELEQQFGSSATFSSFLETRGTTLKDFKQALSRDLELEAYLEGVLFKPVSVSADEVKKFYQKDPDKFKPPVEVRARHILFRTNDEDDDEIVRKKALKVLSDAKKKDADFAALAKKHSEGPSAAKGGELGYFTKNQMVPTFAEAAFALKPGEVSDLVLTKFGYHIIRVEDRRGEKPVKFEDVQPAVERRLLREKRQQTLEQHLKQLRGKAKVIKYMD